MRMKFIAEAALCHKGSVKIAKQFIDSSKRLDADYLKFHLIIADEIADKNYKHYKLFKSFEIVEKNWILISKYAKKQNIKLIFDVLGPDSLKIAIKCGIRTIKLHATDIYNYPLHQIIKKSSIRNVIIGAGGCEVSELVKISKIFKKKKITFMFGYQTYPTITKNLDLSKIGLIKKLIKTKNIQLGYADHSPTGMLETIYNCSSSISYGANIIEKHFSFNKSIKTDLDKSVFNRNEFNKMVNLISEFVNLKKNLNWFHNDEKKYRKSVSKNYFALKDIKKNEVISFSNLNLKRGKFAPKIHIDKILNRKSKVQIKKNQEIKYSLTK